LVLLVLVGEHGLRSGLALVVGWFVGAWAVLVLAMMGALSFVPDSERGLPPLVELAVGVLAVGIGAYVLLRLRTRPDDQVEPSRMAVAARAMTPVRSSGLGFALAGLSPRQWIFLVPAAALFSASPLPASAVVLPLAGAGVASLGVAAPVGLALVVRRRDPQALTAAREWWLRKGDAVAAVAAVLVGVVLIVSALAAGL
jgi:hypothetical protein